MDEPSSLVLGGLPDQTSTTGDQEEGSQSGDTAQPIAKQETKAVTKWKVIVIAVLVLSALGVAFATYRYIHRSEIVQFEEFFFSSAHKTLEAVGKSLEKTLKSLDSLAVSVVSNARVTNQTRPFVTVADFAMRAAKVISLSDAVFLSLMPLVTKEQRQQWGDYVVQHDQWLNTSIDLQEDFDLYQGPLDLAFGKIPTIWGDFGDIPEDIE